MKNKVICQLNILFCNKIDAGDKWEVLSKDMGCLMKDDDSESSEEETLDAKEAYEEAYDRALTPY